MSRKSILSFIKKIDRKIFTTSELSAISGKSSSVVVQALNFLRKQGVVIKIYKGIWAEVTDTPVNPYVVLPFLFPKNRAYVSFISALHIYGIIEQIPQVITVASTTHTKTITTKVGTFSVHKITPSFFDGFDWYNKKGKFLIAEPEKAFVDCLYLSGYKKKQFGHFPELHFPKTFSFSIVDKWIKRIPNSRIKSYVWEKIKKIKQEI